MWSDLEVKYYPFCLLYTSFDILISGLCNTDLKRKKE